MHSVFMEVSFDPKRDEYLTTLSTTRHFYHSGSYKRAEFLQSACAMDLLSLLFV